ncbi:MAG: hypothetical protein AMXMBFR84_04240 [Candidatus Hydrogenedentota bacterium]
MKTCVCLFSVAFLAAWASSDPVRIDSRLEPFVDAHLIGAMNGTHHVLHEPVGRETAFSFDKRWEGRYSAYVTVLKDGDRFRAYYRGLPEAGKDGSDFETTCVAESMDGIAWTKPMVGLHEVLGSKDNNVILFHATPYSHNFAPIVDTRQDAPANERYKAAAGTVDTGLFGFVSEDGLRWTRLDQPILMATDVHKFDSQNVVFWSESEGLYLCYFRSFYDKVRAISRTTSPDFRTWSEPVRMTFGDTPAEHLYTNQTIPYSRAPHIYLAIAARFMPGRRVINETEAQAIGSEAQYSGDCSDTVFMTTRGGSVYDRTFMNAFIRPGLGLNNWTSRTNYPARGVVETGEGELSMYVQRNYGQTTHHLQRLTLRTDGFASINAPYKGGTFTTKPLRFSGKELFLNMATSAAGSLWVEIQEENGQPIPGYTRNDSDELIGDFIARKATWKGNADVSALAGKTVRLHFDMKDADLYAIQFK